MKVDIFSIHLWSSIYDPLRHVLAVMKYFDISFIFSCQNNSLCQLSIKMKTQEKVLKALQTQIESL